MVWFVLLSIALLVLRRTFLGYTKPDAPFRVLARREVAFITSAAEVMFPAGGAIPTSGLEADLPRYADRFLAAVEPRVRLQIRALFALFEHVTIFFKAPGWNGWKRFSSLSLEQRELVLQSWSASSNFARQVVFMSLRAVLTMGYLGHPEVMRHLRVAPYAVQSPILEADLLYPKIGLHPDTIRYSAADLTAPSDGVPIDIEGPLHPAFAESASPPSSETPS